MKATRCTVMNILCVLLMGTGCWSASLSDEDIESARLGAEALTLASDEQVFMMTLSAFSMIKMNRGGRCLQTLNELNTASPEMFQTMSAVAFSQCSHTCPKDLAPYANVEYEKRIGTLVAECDAIGPDPLFSGPLADQRKNFHFGDYLLIRLHMDRLVLAAKNTGGDKAQAAVKAYVDLAPRLSRVMIKRQQDYLREMEAWQNEEQP